MDTVKNMRSPVRFVSRLAILAACGLLNRAEKVPPPDHAVPRRQDVTNIESLEGTNSGDNLGYVHSGTAPAANHPSQFLSTLEHPPADMFVTP